jgi:hypothetical protein
MMPADPSNVERAVSRTLRDSLERMQRSSKELDQAVADFVAACASNRPANALPSMLRAQTASAALSATLEVLSRFVTTALQPSHSAPVEQFDQAESTALDVEAPAQFAAPVIAPAPLAQFAAEPVAEPAAPQPQEWPAAPEPLEWSDAHESHDAPVQAEPFDLDQHPLESEVSEAQHADAHDSPAEEIESLSIEPPPDPALESAPESPLSPEISAVPDALEAIAAWSAPQRPAEPAVPEIAAEEIAAHGEAVPERESGPDGIVDEPELAAESAEVTALEESKIIEDAIAGGIAKLSDRHAFDPLEAAPSAAFADAASFDVSLLSADERELHRRASRVAKVSMQDIKLLQPQQVAIGRENKDICIRLHEEIERAHKEYGRRFKPIMSHPVDYFYDWMVEILAAGDASALGEYPYRTPALRR